MRKLGPVALVLVLAAGSALGLAACGSSGGKEGGTLTGTYASFPSYLDPALSYEVEGWTAMYDTYLPLLTYAHADGAAGSKVVPALAESLPKISNGGKTYTLTLRKGLKYSDGAPVVASDFASSIERLFKMNSPGVGFYEHIVGAEKFAKTKSGRIPGIKTDDRTGKIVIDLTNPRGTFTNELGMLFAAVLPSGTPAKNLTADPPPATGPYMITKSEPGRGWSYARNPYWAKANGPQISEVPAGHVDKIDIRVIRNDSTQVNEIERGKANWMQTPISSDLYNKVKDKYEGTQFRVEHPINLYLFWMNTEKPPFDDVKVRQAVNYAINPAALERIYAGSLAATHQILPEGMPGHKPFDLYPHDMAKAKELLARSQPLGPQHHRLDRQRKPQQRSGRILRRRAQRTRLQRQAEDDQRRQLLRDHRQRNDARPRHRLARLLRGLSAPERLLPADARGGKHRSHLQHEPLAHGRSEAEREDRQAGGTTARAPAGSRIRGTGQGIHGTGADGALRDQHRLDLRQQRNRPGQGDLQSRPSARI